MISHDELETVRVCTKCGRGFPSWSQVPTGGIDGYEVWWTRETVDTTPACGGRILEVVKLEQIRKVLGSAK